MKLASIFAVAIGASAGVSAAPLEPRASFVKVPLPEPLNWVAGRSLFPGNIIAGYSAGEGEYTAETWSAYILAKCQGYAACTSSITYSGTRPPL